MKKTVKINLTGLVFTLDEDAYQVLKDYLDAINARFRELEEGNEIITDIESRIAELFQEKVSDNKQVITIDDVNEVISILGKPEDFLEDENITEDAEKQHDESSKRKQRKLYRDPDNAILGGVAAGLAAYFGIEIWIIRVLLIILTFPIQVLPIVYIIMWIVVPKAVTAAQKLEMRGEKVTVSNIEKTVKEEYESVKENVKRVKESKEYKKTRNVLEEIFHVIGQIILFILKAALFFIGLALILAGVSAIMGLTSVFFFRYSLFPIHIWGDFYSSFNDFFGIFSDPANFTLFSIALFLTIAIPVIALIYGGIKLIFRFKSNDKFIGLTALVLWLLGLITLVSIIAWEGMNFKSFNRTSESHYLEQFDSDTLGVLMQSDPGITNFQSDWYYEEDENWYKISDADRYYGKIDLDIESSDNEKFELIINKISGGKSRTIASTNANMLDYDFKQQGNQIILSPYFSINKFFEWRSPEAEVILLVPEGKYIKIDKSTRFFLDHVENLEDLEDNKLAGKTWIMTGDGLMMPQ